MSDRLPSLGALSNQNILRQQDYGAGSAGGRANERKNTGLLSQRVIVGETRPRSHNVILHKGTRYMLGREDKAFQLIAIQQGYDTIDVALQRKLALNERHQLSRRQMAIEFADGRRKDGVQSSFLTVHNVGANDIIAVNRGYERSHDPYTDGLQRIPHISGNEADDGGTVTIENYHNTILFVPLTTTTVLRMDVMGEGASMMLDAWEVDKGIYDELVDWTIRRDKLAIPQKQAVRADVEKPGDKPQIQLEQGKMYRIGRRTQDAANQKAAEEAGCGFVEVSGFHGETQLSREQLEVEVVSGAYGPVELRVKNTGTDHVDIFGSDDGLDDVLYGKVQPNNSAKRETTISLKDKNGKRIECALNNQYNLSLEPELHNGEVSLYVSERPFST